MEAVDRYAYYAVAAALSMGDANPLDDITNTRRISAVYLRGKEGDLQAIAQTGLAYSKDMR